MTENTEADFRRERAEHALKRFLSEGKYLPEVMRDFHDAKEIFKTMHHVSGWNEKEGWARDISWMDGQIYVIDLFLHFMARHGYTLQRSRAKLEFHDLYEKRRRFRDEQGDELASFLTARMAAAPETSPPETNEAE
ncbi:hypothetical protein D3C71_188940 [compost metagenome]